VVYGTTQSPEKVKKEQKQQFMDLVQYQISSQKKKGLSHSIIEGTDGHSVSPPEGHRANIFKQSMVVGSSAAPGSGSAKQRFIENSYQVDRARNSRLCHLSNQKIWELGERPSSLELQQILD